MVPRPKRAASTPITTPTNNDRKREREVHSVISENKRETKAKTNYTQMYFSVVSQLEQIDRSQIFSVVPTGKL